MSFQLTLSEVFDSARKYALNKSPKATRILDLIVNNEKRDYLNLAFAYLRWIDDEVDDPEKPADLKKIFIHSQLNIIDKIISNQSVDIQKPEEEYLRHYLNFCKECSEPMLASELRNMAEAISWDAERLSCDGIYNNETLRAYIDKMSKSLFNILQGFILPEEKRCSVFLGRFTANVQILRDLLEDISAGFINISSEDIAAYNINVKITDNINLGEWIKDKLKEIDNILTEEVKINRMLPFRLRLFTWYAHIYYLPKIYRIKLYNYNLYAVKNDKKRLRELLVFIYSAAHAFKLLVKEIL